MKRVAFWEVHSERRFSGIGEPGRPDKNLHRIGVRFFVLNPFCLLILKKNMAFADLLVATPMSHNNRKKKYKFKQPHGDCI